MISATTELHDDSNNINNSSEDGSTCTTIIVDQGYEVLRVTTPRRQQTRMGTPSPSSRSSRRFTPSPSRRRLLTTPSPSRRRNKMLTPMRAFSFRRKRKNRVPPGPDSEAAMVVRVSSKGAQGEQKNCTA